MTMPYLIKIMLGGALATGLSSKIYQSYIKKDNTLTKEQKEKHRAIVIGAAEGGLLGYLIADRIYKKKNNGFVEKGMGISIGSGLGIILSSYLIKRNHDIEQGQQEKPLLKS